MDYLDLFCLACVLLGLVLSVAQALVMRSVCHR
jgi:hypothetical protein